MARLTVDMPHVGESVTEAVIGKWLVAPGDAIRRYDPMVEVVTDKVNMEVPAPRDGTIAELLVEEGVTVQMGDAIAEMEVEGAVAEPQSNPSAAVESPSSPSLAGTPEVQDPNRVGSMIVGANVGPTGGEFTDTSLSADAAAETTTSVSDSQSQTVRRQARDPRGARISPVVRKLIEQHGIDVNRIAGSGDGNRVTRRDVERDLEAHTADGRTIDGDEIVAPSPIRRMIAANMERSFREIPHAWGAIEVDMSAAVQFRTVNLDAVQAETGHRMTYLAIVLREVAAALATYRYINASWDDGKILLKGDVNIGVAVAAEQGLVVPVLHGADRMTLVELVAEMARLVAGARTDALRLEDVQGGTFTLNNTGALGSMLGGAIINHPQAAILTTEAIVKRAVVVTAPDGADAISVRPMMNMCMSFDHRIIDGSEAMAFMNDVKARLESLAPDDVRR